MVEKNEKGYIVANFPAGTQVVDGYKYLVKVSENALCEYSKDAFNRVLYYFQKKCGFKVTIDNLNHAEWKESVGGKEIVEITNRANIAYSTANEIFVQDFIKSFSAEIAESAREDFLRELNNTVIGVYIENKGEEIQLELPYCTIEKIADLFENLWNFEPLFSDISRIHNELYDLLKKTDFVKKETNQFCLQCNYKEYVEEDHDQDYEWTHFCFGEEKNDFALGINKIRFAGKENEMEQIKKTVQNIWEKNAGTSVKKLGIIKDVASLNKNDYEMVVSVHYWFDMALIDDGINDSQYLKIVYFGSSLKDKLLVL